MIFPIFLAQSGYSAARIGLLLSFASALNILLVAGVGLFADRFGRRTTLIGVAGLAVLAGLLLALSVDSFPILVLASGLGGIGRGGGIGSGGAWGPMFPAEQPLIAASAEHDRTRAFGHIAFVAVTASAAGSLVAGVPVLLAPSGIPLMTGYRLLFGLSALIMFCVMIVSLPLRETQGQPAPNPAGGEQHPIIPLRTLLGRLGVTNALNGFAFGFMGPLLTVWFYQRFGVGAGQLAILYTVVNLVTAFPYLASASLVRRVGQVRTVVLTRVAGVALLLAMAFVPSLIWVGALFTLRAVMNSLGMPARQSFMMGAAEERYRSRVAAFSSLPSQFTSMVSPAVGGALMEEIMNFPIYGAAFFFLANAVAYHLSFRDADRPREISLGARPQDSPGDD